MAKKDVHVAPRGEKWAVERSGSERASSLHETKADAQKAGIELARKEEASLKIHGKNGKIQEERTYRKDPYPPKG
jgi:hypothetical protein